MKQLLSVFIFCMTALAIMAQTKTTQKVEVVYFHGKQRCVTCMAIEKSTREMLEQDFARQMKDGTVSFKIIDISTIEGAQTAKKYHVTWSS
ncbi:MAG: nitrophenyl compound nitroreductase subunit ArsF family protein, partial [Prevotella sp.]